VISLSVVLFWSEGDQSRNSFIFASEHFSGSLFYLTSICQFLGNVSAFVTDIPVSS